MRPRERVESGEQDLFRARLDQIIDMDHALAKLARTIDWRFLEGRCGAVYQDGPGRPPLPTRLMAGLAILKHAYDLSDERVRRKLASADDGNRQMVNILTAVLTDGLPAGEAACAEAITQGVHSADVVLNILGRHLLKASKTNRA